jgi:signal transduction histidine kinase
MAAGAAKANISPRLERLHAKVQHIAAEISDISHRLHPATLEHVGLTSAVKDFCRELSDHKVLQVEFTHHDITRGLPEDVALCLFRVVQEGLQNVMKHSGSKSAFIELTGSPQEIRLSLWDHGSGFDPESAKPGLGLVSMRERLRHVGGSISITSRPGAGTRIEVRVPLQHVGH